MDIALINGSSPCIDKENISEKKLLNKIYLVWFVRREDNER